VSIVLTVFLPAATQTGATQTGANRSGDPAAHPPTELTSPDGRIHV